MSMNMGKSAAGLLGIAALSLSLVGQAQAIPLFAGTNGSNRSAEADFSIQGGNLQVVLTNTSLVDVLLPVDVLTGVFFTVPGPPTSSLSALLTAGSTVIHDTPPAGGIVGGEWAYLWH